MNRCAVSLQTCRVPDDAAARWPGARRPLRAAQSVRPGGIEAQTGNDEKHVVAPCVDANPFSFPALAVAPKASGRHGTAKPPSGLEDIRRRAGAIESTRTAGPVATAAHIRRADDSIAGRDRRLDLGGGRWRCGRITIVQRCSFPQLIMVGVRRWAGAAREKNDSCDGQQANKAHQTTITCGKRAARFFASVRSPACPARVFVTTKGC